MKDIISLEGIKPFLTNCEYAEKIKIFDSLESTNITAKELAKSESAHGQVIIADSQTKGKGRYGKSFHSPPGHGIYMSLVLPKPELWRDAPMQATLFAAVKVCESIEALSNKEPHIKWVNDIYLGGKKICGILTEAVKDSIIIGIGINVSTPSSAFPEHLREIAGAIFESETPTVTRNRIIAEIINRTVPFEQLCGGKELVDKYRRRLMMLGEDISAIEQFEVLGVRS